MWLPRRALRRLGFRRRSDALWLCEAGYGLPADAHLSIYAWGPPHRPIQLASFHVTRPLGRQVVHVYYREGPPGCWFPEGHTPSVQIRQLGGDPFDLVALADRIADRLVRRLGATLRARATDPARSPDST